VEGMLRVIHRVGGLRVPGLGMLQKGGLSRGIEGWGDGDDEECMCMSAPFMSSLFN